MLCVVGKHACNIAFICCSQHAADGPLTEKDKVYALFRNNDWILIAIALVISHSNVPLMLKPRIHPESRTTHKKQKDGTHHFGYHMHDQGFIIKAKVLYQYLPYYGVGYKISTKSQRRQKPNLHAIEKNKTTTDIATYFLLLLSVSDISH